MEFREKYKSWVNKQFEIVNKYNKLLPFYKQIKVLFRGESQKFKTPLKPSVFREGKILLDINNIYSEAKAKFYNDFKEEKTNFDKLVKMQHYKIPTKLVDVTDDPDVALYFACSENPRRKGRIFALFISNEGIIYPENPLIDLITTSIICAGKQSIFESNEILDLKRSINKYNMWDTSDVKNKYLDNANLTYKIFIEGAKSRYNLKDKVYYAHDLIGVFNCVPNYINQRIIRQRSSFIVGGISMEDSVLKGILHYDKIHPFLQILESNNINDIIHSISKINFDDQKCGKYLSVFLENFKDKNILNQDEYLYSFSLETFKEFHSQRIKDSIEYLNYLLFLYGLYGCEGKFSFYNDLIVPAKEKEKLLSDLSKKNKMSESYIYPDLEHYALEIKRKYKLQ